METETYIFHLGAYDVPSLIPQLSRALKVRTEQRSRMAYPGVWYYIDKIGGLPKGKRMPRGFRIALSIVLLLAGVFLFVPGAMDPENLRVPLTAGSIAILVGLFSLVRSCKKKSGNKRFDHAAEILLKGKDKLTEEHGIRVCFDEEGMTIASPDSEDTVIGYERLETVVETTDLYLIVYDQNALVLQKRDLCGVSAEEFSAFLTEYKYVHNSDN